MVDELHRLDAARKPRSDVGSYRVPEGTRVYAVGDIHGRPDLLEAIRGRILIDCGRDPPDHRIVVYLGDYLDRGPNGRGVIEALIASPLPGFESIHLKGNHEALMLDFLETGDNIEIWLFNGGRQTLKSYGVEVSDLFKAKPDAALIRGQLIDALASEHLEFLKSLRLSYCQGDYVFVHAGIRPGIRLDDQKPFDLMWIRQEFLNAVEDFGFRVVHGHTWSPHPVVRANRIGIDTGAFDSGCLTCLVLEGDGYRFLRS